MLWGNIAARATRGGLVLTFLLPSLFHSRMPLVGAYLADTRWGRFKTICIAVGITLVGHILLIVSAIPAVIENKDACLAVFILAIIIMGLGTGWFKSSGE